MSNLDIMTPQYLLASMQRALLNEVTPDLRGVAVRVGEDGVACRFVFESAITDEARERIDDIETEVIADYSGLTPVRCIGEHVPVDQPRSLHPGELWAFLRHEF